MNARVGSGVLLPLGLLALAAYFVFAAVQGEYGVLRRIALEAEREGLDARLGHLEARAARLEARRLSLSDESLDLDLLDERAREILGRVRDDEIVIE